MWEYPDIDPIAIALGPIAIHWYALSYLAGIAIAWWLFGFRNRLPTGGFSRDDVSDLVFYGVLGVVLGGRLGYVLFYGLGAVSEDPWSLFYVWRGGMSFHGGMIGVAIAVWRFARKHSRSFFSVIDLVAPCVPPALGCGRIGNFINAELPGRVADVPWAVIYPGDYLPRHPSSLYQALLEGPVLFALVWWFARVPRPEMAPTGAFLAGYGVLRFISEFFREPDPHIGFVAFDWMTRGQLLSLPMVLLGATLIAWGYRNRDTVASA